jgi:hypothetical protein
MWLMNANDVNNMNQKFKAIDILKIGQEGDEDSQEYSISIRKVIYMYRNEEWKESFQVQVQSGKMGRTETFSVPQIMKRKFLQDCGISEPIASQYYQQLRKKILQTELTDEYISYVMERNGLQMVNGRWMQVFSNGSMDADGFRSDIKSGMDGICFPEEAVGEKQKYKRDIQHLFSIYNENPIIFYPLFFLNIMAITNGYFRHIGEDTFMRISVWLDGESGSGKTELAKVGTYAFADPECGGRLLVSVTGRRKEILSLLLKSSGAVCVVDDVKLENVRERKNSVRNNVDDCLRSIFQGFLTDSASGDYGDKKIDCCAIITGEYLDTYESQNARLLYIKVSGFLKNRKNAEALRRLQGEPTLLTSVCGGYIQFLLKKMEESSFPELVKAKLKELRARKTMYSEINNAERLHENRSMLEMAEWLTEKCFLDMGMEENFISDFRVAAIKSIDNVMEETFYLLGGGQMVLRKVMEQMLLNAKIHKAEYRETRHRFTWRDNPGCAYEQVNFWMNRKDDFVYIEDYEKSLQKGDIEKYQREQEVLLIRKERLIDLFHEEVQKLQKATGAFSSKLVGDIEKLLPRLLREEQLIYQIHRSDSSMGRPAMEYPVYDRYTFYNQDDEETVYRVDFENVVQINTEHPYVAPLCRCMQATETETEVVPERCKVEARDGGEMKETEIYEKRRKFIRGKSLYRKR